MIGSFTSGTTASLVTKNRTKKISQLFEDGSLCSRCLKDHIYLCDMIGSFTSGATASILAKNLTKNLYQPFKEVQCSNSEFKLITPKSITGTILGPFWEYFGTILGLF